MSTKLEMKRDDVPKSWLGKDFIKKEKTPERKQSRFSRGQCIAVSRRIVKVHNEDAWMVESEKTDGKFYKVTIDGGCECYDNSISHNVCKHVFSIVRRGIA